MCGTIRTRAVHPGGWCAEVHGATESLLHRAIFAVAFPLAPRILRLDFASQWMSNRLRRHLRREAL